MQPAGSYDPERGHLGVTAELARLEAQVRVSWPQEERLLRAIGLRDGLEVLEVGCGPGFFTERLLTYALGRGLEEYDRPVIRKITREAAEYRWSSMILAIVNSAPFQMRRVSDDHH